MLGLISVLYQLSTSTIFTLFLGFMTSVSVRKLTGALESELELLVSVMLIQETEQSPDDDSPALES